MNLCQAIREGTIDFATVTEKLIHIVVFIWISSDPGASSFSVTEFFITEAVFEFLHGLEKDSQIRRWGGRSKYSFVIGSNEHVSAPSTSEWQISPSRPFICQEIRPSAQVTCGKQNRWILIKAKCGKCPGIVDLSYLFLSWL